MARKVVFLDRDGTINVDRGFVHRIEDWEFTDRAAEALGRLRRQGFALAVVTNQSGIALGYYTREDVAALHEHMQRELARRDARIDAIAICPHKASDQCDCRKPRTGMARQIERQLGESIRYEASWMIGDKPADIQFGAALGMRTVLLASQYWNASEPGCQPDAIADSLFEAAERICPEPGGGAR